MLEGDAVGILVRVGVALGFRLGRALILGFGEIDGVMLGAVGGMKHVSGRVGVKFSFCYN